MSSAHIQKEAKCFGFFFIFFLVLLYSFPQKIILKTLLKALS